MARVDQDSEERDKQPLRLSQLVDCSLCDTTQEVEFVAPDGVYELDELVEPPETVHTCINCGFQCEVTYSGWTVNDEA